MILAARESEVPFVGGKIGEGFGWVAWLGQVGGLWWLGWDGGDGDAPKSPLFVAGLPSPSPRWEGGEEEAAEGQVL